jgi:hypothetical protein
MPQTSVQAALPRKPTLPSLVSHKEKWGVSVTALAHRCYLLGMYTDWEYRALSIEIAKHGYRKAEPRPIERETSQIIKKVLSYLREDGLTRSTVATQLGVAVSDLDVLMFGLAITGIEGGRLTKPSSRVTASDLGWEIIEGA